MARLTGIGGRGRTGRHHQEIGLERVVVGRRRGSFLVKWKVTVSDQMETPARALSPQTLISPASPARAAKALKLSIIVTTTARHGIWDPTFPELVEALLGIEIIDPSSVNAFNDVRVARAIEATGRKKLIFVGISLEVCAAFPSLSRTTRP